MNSIAQTLARQQAPSVGSVVKKIMGINPDLDVSKIIELIRQATKRQDSKAGEFSGVEMVDEARALELARGTLTGDRARHQFSSH